MSTLRLPMAWRVVVALLLTLPLLVGAERPALAQTPVQIHITSGGFDPPTLSVPVGTEVTWVNHDTVEHILSSVDGDFTAQTMAPNAAFAITLQIPGAYSLQIDGDPALSGSITATTGVRDLDAAPAASPPAATDIPAAPPADAGTSAQLAQTAPGRLAHIHAGSCAELGIVVYSLSGLQSYRIEPTNENRGADELLVGTANVALPDLFTEPFSIHIHESVANKQNYIACADVGGQPTGDWTPEAGLILALSEQSGSGLDGFATLRPAPDGGTDVRLFLSGPIAAAAPAAPDTTPPTTYSSPTYGYSISYNDTWNVTEDVSSAGRDRFVLTNGASYVTFTGAAEFDGDTTACVEAFQDDLLADPNVSNVAIRIGPDGQPLVGGTPATGSFAVFDHDYQFSTGPQAYTLFVGCVPLVPGEAVLAVVQNVPAADFDAEVAARDGLLRGLSLNQ